MNKLNLFLFFSSPFFLSVLGFEFRASHLLVRCFNNWTTLSALFPVGYFWDRLSRAICPGWLWTVVLLISAFQVARIIGMSHLCCFFLWWCWCLSQGLVFCFHSTTSARPPALFALVIFQIGARPQSYLCLPCSWNCSHAYDVLLIYWGRISLTFEPKSSQSQIPKWPGISEMSHHGWPYFFVFSLQHQAKMYWFLEVI
jgi:hypothetical protein